MHLKNDVFCELPFGKSLGLLKDSVQCCTHTGACTAFHDSPVQPAHQTPWSWSWKDQGWQRKTPVKKYFKVLCHEALVSFRSTFFPFTAIPLSFLFKCPVIFWAELAKTGSVDSYSIVSVPQTETLIYTSSAFHKEVSVSSLFQEIHEVMCCNGLMGIWALHRQEAREKQMCVSDLILSPATQTFFCVLFLIDISVSLGLITLSNKVK